MEHRIAHACGHEQAHYIPGYPSQQDRKARWLRTTKCRICFVDDKRSEEAEAAARNATAIAHLDLPELVGSGRQVSWATTIRAKRLAAIMAAPSIDDASGHQACVAVTDAKWWIDHRDLTDTNLIAKGRLHMSAADTNIAGAQLTSVATLA
ncbi:hypothetical protein [Sphingomonas aerophila]|uniref:Uncharacterized protein n=1 Tax=Sphingomonas aerophila TaxID=1344948 RepID=A0A7W9B9Q1_9SPHN|nr:hypothetical protein [Sphingomonas aerophila]MBB5713207.1 hypothetical protein [Sphingomonas aerophila]